MKKIFDFHRTTMPADRKADYYLCYHDSSVFIDFNSSASNEISLIRISFDGFGCCDIEKQSKKLNLKDSQEFLKQIKQDNLNQEVIAELVKKLIFLNKDFIWTDALEKYGLIKK